MFRYERDLQHRCYQGEQNEKDDSCRGFNVRLFFRVIC